MPPEIAERYMTVTEAVKALGLSKQGVHYLIQTGKLRAVRMGNYWYVERGAVKDMIRKRGGVT